MLRMISTIFSTLETLKLQRVVQSCVSRVSFKFWLQQHPATKCLLSNGEVAAFSLKEFWWPASGEWCGHSSNGSNTTNAGISKTFWETCGSMFRRRETKSEDHTRSAKRQSTAEPSTAVALCTARSYNILSRGIVHLDTNDTKIKHGNFDAKLFNFWEHRPRWCTRKLTAQKRVLWAKEIPTKLIPCRCWGKCIAAFKPGPVQCPQCLNTLDRTASPRTCARMAAAIDAFQLAKLWPM